MMFTNTRRTTAGCGVLVLGLAAGLLVAPAAQAAPTTSPASSLLGPTISTVPTLTTLTSGIGAVLTPMQTLVSAPTTGTAPAVGDLRASLVDAWNVLNTLSTTASTPLTSVSTPLTTARLSTDAAHAAAGLQALAATTVTTAGTTTPIAVDLEQAAASTATSLQTLSDALAGTTLSVSDLLLGPTSVLSTPVGTSLLDVQADLDALSLSMQRVVDAGTLSDLVAGNTVSVPVTIGSGGTTVGGQPVTVASTSTSTSTSTTTNTTTNTGGGGAAEQPAAPAPAPAAPVTGTPVGAPAALSRLTVERSVGVVYPSKDGYRDVVRFTLGGLTSTGSSQASGVVRVLGTTTSDDPIALQGSAVLRQGSTVVKRWSVTRSDQVLTWNGRKGSKVVPGAYSLTVAARDASGQPLTATTAVRVSKKRLAPATAKVKSLATSGVHDMAAKPRAGLAKGRVTLRLTTVAPVVKGTQKLIFQRGGKRIAVPVKQGTHTSRSITVPASFARFRILHTWKKGQVELKSIRYTYSYKKLK